MVCNVGFVPQCSKSLIGTPKVKPRLSERFGASAGAFASSHLAASPPFFSAEPRASKPQKAVGTHGWQRWIRAAVLQITHWDMQSQAKHCRAVSRVCQSLCFKPLAASPLFSAEPRACLKPQKAVQTHDWQRWIRAAVLQITHWDMQSQAKHCRAASRVCQSLCFKPLGCFPPFFSRAQSLQAPKSSTDS